MMKISTPEPIVIMDCYWKGISIYDCRKFALYGLTYPGARLNFYCGEHLIRAAIEGVYEGFKPFITIPLYR